MQYGNIVIGSGSGGAATAARLSEDGKATVWLLEAGGKDRHPFIHIPVLFPYFLTKPNTTWLRKSEPVPDLNGRPIFFPSGKVLGGSSAINGMLYIRCQAQDYDDWRDAGNAGWGWDDVLPYFKKMEDHQNGESDFRSVGGPIAVTDTLPRNDSSYQFLEAAAATGIPHIPDLNTGDQHCIATVQRTIRNNAATIYHPVGTFKMGNAAMSVVDDRLRVSGLSGLRIADASIMPLITSGNTNAPSIMVGEKCADMILSERNR